MCSKRNKKAGIEKRPARHTNRHSEKGVALLMVISSILVLTAIMYNFKFEVGINKIKAANIQNKSQARLNAESGLNFALARLEIYQTAYNHIITNERMKGKVSTEVLNQIWQLPFVYPIPVTDKMGLIAKSAIQDFEEEAFIEGEISLSITSLGSKINLNRLRNTKYTWPPVPTPTPTPIPRDQTGDVPPDEDDRQQTNPTGNSETADELEKKLVEMMRTAFERKREQDEFFYNKYQGTRFEELIAALRFYISDPGTYESPFSNQIESELQKIGLEPKGAPITSISELSLLPGWNDDLIGLIENEVTTHGEIVIDVNKVTANILTLLIPRITEEDIANFFKYKNNPEAPVTFQKLEDLKSYFTEEARIVDSNEFDNQVDRLKEAGIKFGVSPLLFEIQSMGTYNGTEYRISAIVEIRYEEPDDQQNPAGPGGAPGGSPGGVPAAPSPSPSPTQGAGGGTSQAEEPPQKLKRPLVVSVSSG